MFQKNCKHDTEIGYGAHVIFFRLTLHWPYIYFNHSFFHLSGLWLILKEMLVYELENHNKSGKQLKFTNIASKKYLMKNQFIPGRREALF